MSRREIQREYEQLQPAGLVLGHRVIVSKAGIGQAYKGTIAALSADGAEIKFERVKYSDSFLPGDLVRALHLGRHAIVATVITSAHGVVHLSIGRQDAELEER